MHIQFVDQPQARTQLLPLTYTRPIADLRVGILKITQKWTNALHAESFGFGTEEYLSGKFAPVENPSMYIYNGILPSPLLISVIESLPEKTGIWAGDQILASNAPIAQCTDKLYFEEPIATVAYCWDIFRLNGEQIKNDFVTITSGRESQPVHDAHTVCYGEDIFIEKGVKIKAAVLNAENGPIYLGANSEVSEGALIKGPFSLGESSVVNMGAKMRGDTTIGPHCKAGGEISNAVFQGYSNKGHDGFLGNAVLGEWCNLGADTNNSNLKNNYAHVKMWDFSTGRFKDTGLQFCGLIMGDHSKCGINTMFNTGTTIGVSANIFGEGFPRNIIPSFSWGGASGFMTYKLSKVYETADLVMSRRAVPLNEVEKDILQHIFDATQEHRVWDKK